MSFFDLKDQYPDAFQQWFAAYPKKSAKGDAFLAYRQQIKAGHKPEDMLAGCQAFAALCRKEKTEKRFIPHPGTWLRAQRWLDENLQPDPVLSPDQIAANIERADRLLRRGKYAEWKQ